MFHYREHGNVSAKYRFMNLLMKLAFHARVTVLEQVRGSVGEPTPGGGLPASNIRT